MKKLILFISLTPILLLSQPSFNVTDNNGNTWNSNEILEAGTSIVVCFFSPSMTCWPSANHIIKLAEADSLYGECNDIFFLQVAQWGNEYQTTSFLEEFGNVEIPYVVGYYEGQTLTFDWVDWGLQWAYETWLLRTDGSYEFDIPFGWDLDQQVLIDALEDDGFKECEQNLSIQESNNTNNIVQTLDILGRKRTNTGFQIHIYNDGSAEKKYLIK